MYRSISLCSTLSPPQPSAFYWGRGVGWRQSVQLIAVHPITLASFTAIDQEIGAHKFSSSEYAVVRRAIHSTADFQLKDLFFFSQGAIAAGISALRAQTPVIVDVRMVAVGVMNQLHRLGLEPIAAIAQAPESPPPGQTRTEAGIRQLAVEYPNGIYVVGNAPTALLAIAELCRLGQLNPALVIGVPVGFVSVEQSKRAIAEVAVPQIRVEGRKGGSPIAAGIVNALVNLALADERE